MNKDNKWKKRATLFLTSQAISLFGSSLVQYAIIWFITLKTGSGVMMTIATLGGFIPQIFISLFAGVWADKYNKKYLIMIADIFIAVSTLIIAILFFMGLDYIGLLFVVLVTRSIGSGIQTPTINSFIPEVIPQKNLMQINGINQTIQSIMMIISPVVSMALLMKASIEYIFLIDVISCIIGISILSLVKYEFEKKKNEKIDYFGTIKEGIIYTKKNKFISRIMVYSLVMNFIITPVAILTPLLVKRTFTGGEFELMLNEIVFFVGTILGGIIISSWGGFKNRIHTIGLGCIICGVFSVMMGFPFSFVYYLICMALIGVTMPIFNTPSITLFQENIDADKQGRVFSLFSVLAGTVMPISMVIFGPLADIIKIEYLIIGSGIAFVIISLLMLKDRILKSNSTLKENKYSLKTNITNNFNL